MTKAPCSSCKIAGILPRNAHADAPSCRLSSVHQPCHPCHREGAPKVRLVVRLAPLLHSPSPRSRRRRADQPVVSITSTQARLWPPAARSSVSHLTWIPFAHCPSRHLPVGNRIVPTPCFTLSCHSPSCRSPLESNSTPCPTRLPVDQVPMGKHSTTRKIAAHASRPTVA